MDNERILMTEISKLNDNEREQVMNFIEALKRRNSSPTSNLKPHPTFNPTEAFI